MWIDIPAGVVHRLSEHYGPRVLSWLGRVKSALSVAAERWRVRLDGIHDAGWTSVVAYGTTEAGRLVLIKALPDTDRYEHEREALTHWLEAPVNRLLAFNDADQMLLLDAVAGMPGGGVRPADHERRVAGALGRLHETVVAVDCPVPLLTDYYRRLVVPRIERRAERFGHAVGADLVTRCIQLCHALCRRPERRRLLHADLYAENVLFDGAGEPVFIDPHAKIGSPAFDWAFWCVYYLPTSGFADRTALCREHAPNEFEEAMCWALTLTIDGAFYYLANGGEVCAMIAVLNSEPLAPLVRST